MPPKNDKKKFKGTLKGLEESSNDVEEKSVAVSGSHNGKQYRTVLRMKTDASSFSK